MRSLVIVLMLGCGRIGFDTPGDDTNPIVDAAPDTLPPDTLPPNALTKSWGEDPANDFRNVTRDTYLSNSGALERTFNYGGADNIRVRDDEVALISFDLSALPQDAQIVDAKLRFVAEETNNAPIVIRRLLESWEEGASDGVAGTANWTTRNTMPWSGMGAAPPSADSSSVTVMAPAAIGEVTFPLPATMVDALAKQPNFGIVLSTTNGNRLQLMSKENTAGSRPRLKITFVPN